MEDFSKLTDAELKLRIRDLAGDVYNYFPPATDASRDRAKVLLPLAQAEDSRRNEEKQTLLELHEHISQLRDQLAALSATGQAAAAEQILVAVDALERRLDAIPRRGDVARTGGAARRAVSKKHKRRGSKKTKRSGKRSTARRNGKLRKVSRSRSRR